MEKQHVHETNPKRTFVTVIIFLVIIIIGLLTVRQPELKYELSPSSTVEWVTSDESAVYPYDLEYILSGEIDTVLLIDIRDRFAFGRGHIEGAENISANSLLRPENIDRLEQLKQAGITVAIYGNDQLEANGPWMVIRQLGFDNVKVLLGGYDYYRKWKDNLGETYYDDSYLLGAPRFNYAEVAKTSLSTAGEAPGEEKQTLNIQRRKKSKAAEGGC